MHERPRLDRIYRGGRGALSTGWSGRDGAPELRDASNSVVGSTTTDLNKFKTPSLRGLAARAPYFHNGSAATLLDVINAYEAVGFQYGFSEDEKANLVAFLESL